MGHVPARPFPQAGAGAHVSRREHRRGRASGAVAARRLGTRGEDLAARFLEERGAIVCRRNLRIGADEIDLLVRFGRMLVAVEVKTRTAAEPIDEFTPGQAAHLRRAARSAGAGRCDLVTVRIDRAGAALRWIPGVC